MVRGELKCGVRLPKRSVIEDHKALIGLNMKESNEHQGVQEMDGE